MNNSNYQDEIWLNGLMYQLYDGTNKGNGSFWKQENRPLNFLVADFIIRGIVILMRVLVIIYWYCQDK